MIFSGHHHGGTAEPSGPRSRSPCSGGDAQHRQPGALLAVVLLTDNTAFR